MSKIIITGNEPLTSGTMCYFALDGRSEESLHFRGCPHVFSVAPGEHRIALNTLSPFRRGLAAAGGATAGSRFLESMTDDSWEGTVTLSSPDSVLLVYVDSKFKTQFRISVIREDEVEAAVAAYASRKSAFSGKKLAIIVGILLLLGIGAFLFYNAPVGKVANNTDVSGKYAEPTETFAPTTETFAPTTETAVPTEPEATEATEAPQQVNYTVYFNRECTLLDAPGGKETDNVFLKGQWATAVDVSGKYTKVSSEYFTVKEYQRDNSIWNHAEGWVLTSSLSMDMVGEQCQFSGKLDQNKANRLVNMYKNFCEYPYSYFEDLNQLDTGKSYTITRDDGSYATTAYAAKGISSVADLIAASKAFCTENFVNNTVAPYFNDGNGHYSDKDGTLCFYENFGAGGQRVFICSLTANGDGSYTAAGYLEFTDTPLSYRIVSEGGYWKIDSAG